MTGSLQKYIKIPAKDLAQRYHELTKEIQAEKEKAGGWSKQTGQLLKERGVLDAIGYYRFADWFQTRSSK